MSESSPPGPSRRPDEFYVGYLPMPAGHLRFIRIAVPAMLWIMVACAAAIAYFQRSPGDAVWDQGNTVNRTGILHELPYPHLMFPAAETMPVFLVEQGKKGTTARCKGLDGKLVRVTGWRLERDGREILELAPEAKAIGVLGGEVPTVPEDRDLGPVELSGEVVDYKCFLGAMKPGDGKTHKACAALCITGGIPPALVTIDANGRREYLILAYGDGGPMRKWISELAGEPVRISGHLHERGSLRVLWVDSVVRASR